MAKLHIALPKSSLLRFANSGRIFYLDLEDNQIKPAYAKTYNTEIDYYPDETERFLEKEIEAPLGKLYEALENFSNKKGPYTYPPQLKDLLIRCIAVQYLRVSKTSTYIKSKSVFGQILKLPDMFFSPLHRNDLPLTKMAINTFQEEFWEHEANICIVDKDTCSSSFVLPTCHYYGIGKCVFFILSPYYAFILLPKYANDRYRIDDYRLYIRIKKNEDFEMFYPGVIKQELEYGAGRLIGMKDELERIQKYCEQM